MGLIKRLNKKYRGFGIAVFLVRRLLRVNLTAIFEYWRV